MKNLITRKQLSEILHVSIPTIIRWEKKGLPVIRFNSIVRYELDNVEGWLDHVNETKI